MPEIDVPFTAGEEASRVSALEQFQRDLSERGVKNWGKITDSAVAYAQQSVTDTMHAQKERVLERAQDLIKDALEGKRYAGQAEFVAEMRKVLGFPTSGNFGEKGNLNNLAGDRRLRMIYDMQMTRAHAEIKAQEDKESGADVLFPAQELVRGASVKEPRDWIARWQEAGGTFYDGRMMALKDDGIWTRISAFGEPYPPFDYNSQMVVRDVSIREAIDVGLLPENALEDALKDYERINGDEETESELPEPETLMPATSNPVEDVYPSKELTEKDFTDWEKENGSPRYDEWLKNKELTRASKTTLGETYGRLGLLDAVAYTDPNTRKRQACAYVKGGGQTVLPIREGENGRTVSLLNEGFVLKNAKELGFYDNCPSCGVAFEATCRGATVKAKPITAFSAKEWNDVFAGCLFEQQGLPAFCALRDSVFFVPTMERNTLYSLSHSEAQNFLRYIHDNNLPAGRYLLGYLRENSRHLIACEILPNKVARFFDPQSGNAWLGGASLPAHILSELHPSDLVKPVMLFRTDNAPMNFEKLNRLITER